MTSWSAHLGPFVLTLHPWWWFVGLGVRQGAARVDPDQPWPIHLQVGLGPITVKVVRDG